MILIKLNSSNSTDMSELKLPKLYRKIFAILFFLISYNSTIAQMRQVYVDTLGKENAIRRISFISPSVGYVSFRDWIGYTIDSGHTFTKKYITRGNVNLNGYYINTLAGFAIGGVQTIDKNTIIAYGGYGLVPAILKSTDGGNTFKLVYYSQFNNMELRTAVLDMIFPENNGIGYAVDADRILKTTNFGNNWNVVRVDPASYFDRLEAADNNTVTAMSTEYETNKLLQTTNGGVSWRAVKVPLLPNGKFISAYFLSSLKGYVNMFDDKHRSYIFKTTNGGVSWILQNNVDAASFGTSKMSFINDSTGYALAFPNLYKTVNSGAVWEELPGDGTYGSLNDMQVFSANQIWAGGYHGFLEMTSNGGGTPKPVAQFLIDTSGVAATSKVALYNYSRSDYMYKWFKNNILISTAYSVVYDHKNDEYLDTVKLIVSNGVTTDTLVKYQYYRKPIPPAASITSFTPKYGKKGSVITITGNNFVGVSAVSFGGTPAISFNVTSPTSISAILDSGRSGEIKVMTIYGNPTIQGFSSQTPVLNSFTPKSGGPGTIIYITGENLFLGRSYSIKFGNTPAASFSITSGNSMNATVGSGTSGDITYETEYGTATISGFMYIPPLPPPAISSFSPKQGDEGDVVTITGTNFIAVTSVNFGVIPAASFSVISSTSIKAIVGKGASGKVFVTTPTGKDSLAGFEYLTPIISSFSPAVGGTGTVVNITGTNFTGVSSVRFGGINASSFTVNSATSITAIVAAGASGSVAITSPHGTFEFPGFQFSTVPRINSFSPVSGPPGTVVKIYGSNFSNIASENIVWFGAVKGEVSSATSTSITVTAPAAATYQPLTVSIKGLTSVSPLAFLVTFPEREITTRTYSQMNFNTGSKPYDVLVSDLDGDGKPDVILRSVDSISYFQNISSKGVLKLGNRVDLSVPNVRVNIRISDLDGDGKPDIVFARNNQVSMFKNTSIPGSISFGPIVDLFIIPEVMDMAVGDVNGDGKPDIVMIDYNETAVSLNTSSSANLSFAAPVKLANKYFHNPNSVTIVDFDGDGKNDIAVSNTYNKFYTEQQNSAISLYRNTFKNDTLSFEPEINYGSPGVYNNITSGDLDGDGRPEVICGLGGWYIQSNNTFTGGNRITVLNNTSTPGKISFVGKEFNTDYMGGNAAQAVAIGNINGDSKPDIAVAHSLDHVGVLKNNGSKGSVSFELPVTYNANNGTLKGSSMLRITIADLDNDLKPEILVGNLGYNTLTIFKNSDSPIKKEVCINGNTTITSDIQGSGYQWQVNTGASFTNLTDNANYSGSNTQSLQITNIPVEWNDYQYRCLTGEKYSSIFALVVDSPTVPKITIAASDTIICSGSSVTFNSTPVNGGDAPSYQWLVNDTDAGINSATFTTSSLTNNSQVKLIMTSSVVCSDPLKANSNIIKISVKERIAPGVSITGSATKICSGTSVTFSAVSVNGGSSPTFQWQVNGVNLGGNSSSFQSNVLKNQDEVKVVISSNALCLTNATSSSNMILMDVEEPVTPLINLINGSIVIIDPDTTTNYTWQVLIDSKWSDVIPLTGTLIYNPNLRGEYRVKSVKKQCTSYSSSQLIQEILRQPANGAFGILFPNPASMSITIDHLKLTDNWETLTITNSEGITVLPVYKVENKTKIIIDITSLQSGSYFATARRKNGKLASLKFIKP